ncbi:hypothetical protein ACFL5U_02920 [Candidatus Margulisiibacteriota bacterium]
MTRAGATKSAPKMFGRLPRDVADKSFRASTSFFSRGKKQFYTGALPGNLFVISTRAMTDCQITWPNVVDIVKQSSGEYLTTDSDGREAVVSATWLRYPSNGDLKILLLSPSQFSEVAAILGLPKARLSAAVLVTTIYSGVFNVDPKESLPPNTLDRFLRWRDHGEDTLPKRLRRFAWFTRRRTDTTSKVLYPPYAPRQKGRLPNWVQPGQPLTARLLDGAAGLRHFEISGQGDGESHRFGYSAQGLTELKSPDGPNDDTRKPFPMKELKQVLPEAPTVDTLDGWIQPNIIAAKSEAFLHLGSYQGAPLRLYHRSLQTSKKYFVVVNNSNGQITIFVSKKEDQAPFAKLEMTTLFALRRDLTHLRLDDC